MTRNNSLSIRPILLALLVTLIWGVSFVVLKVGLSRFPPFLFSGLRFLFASLPLIFISPKNLPWKSVFWVGLFLGTFQFGFLFSGLRAGMPAGLASLFMQAQAVFTIIFSALIFKEVPTLMQGLGIIFCTVGLAALGRGVHGVIPGVAIILVLSASLSWSIGNIFMKKAGNVNTFRLVSWASIVPIFPMFILSFFFETGQRELLVNLNGSAVASLLYVSLLSTIFAFGLWGWLLKKYPSHLIVPFSAAIPLFGILSAHMFLGEPISDRLVVTLPFVIIGLALIILGRKKAGR